MSGNITKNLPNALACTPGNIGKGLLVEALLGLEQAINRTFGNAGGRGHVAGGDTIIAMVAKERDGVMENDRLDR